MAQHLQPRHGSSIETREASFSVIQLELIADVEGLDVVNARFRIQGEDSAFDGLSVGRVALSGDQFPLAGAAGDRLAVGDVGFVVADAEGLGKQGGEYGLYSVLVGVGVAEEDVVLLAHVLPRRLMPWSVEINWCGQGIKHFRSLRGISEDK